jgi:hypothetical protein
VERLINLKRNKIISALLSFFYYFDIKIKIKRMNEEKKQIEGHQSMLIPFVTEMTKPKSYSYSENRIKVF